MKQLTSCVMACAIMLAPMAFAQMPMGGGKGHGMNGSGMMGHGHEGISMVRHRYVMSNGLDPLYANHRNPLVSSSDILTRGKALYETNCSVCHGTLGLGDGPAAKGLDPAPANLTVAIKMPISSDAYLDWTISEGGVPVQSAMPPFKTSLSSNDIWSVILYLRTL